MAGDKHQACFLTSQQEIDRSTEFKEPLALLKRVDLKDKNAPSDHVSDVLAPPTQPNMVASIFKTVQNG